MFLFALKNILSRPMRTALAVIGMTVAILGMVGLYSITAGLDRVVGSTLSRVPGLVAMQRGAPIPLFSTLPKSWTEELESIPGVRAVSPECWIRANVIEGEMIISPPRLLCGTDIIRRNKLNIAVFRGDIIQGRYLDEQDIGTFACVISKQIAEENDKTIGDSLEVNGQQLKIVGIYYTGSILLDVAIIIDEAPFRQMARFDENTVSSFYIEQDGSIADNELLKNIKDHFRGRGLEPWRGSMFLSGSHSSENPITSFIKQIDRALKKNLEDQHKKNPDKKPEENSKRKKRPNRKSTANKLADDPMEVRLATDWAGRIDKFAEDLDIALALLTSLGLFIAVVSIVNTMLMSVTERVSEFGILRANGWNKWDLIRLITFESFLLGVAGGIIGATLGWGATHVVNAMIPSKIELYASPSLLIFAFFFSAILGIASGVYPAIWAARLKPMDAIRRN